MDAEARVGKNTVSLLPDERVLAKLQCNHIQGGRSYEGSLYVTSQRLVYIPWPASETRGARHFEILLAEVSGVSVAPRGSNWRDGSWRRRLQVTRSPGAAELFVVWRPGKAAGLIERASHGITG